MILRKFVFLATGSILLLRLVDNVAQLFTKLSAHTGTSIDQICLFLHQGRSVIWLGNRDSEDRGFGHFPLSPDMLLTWC